VLVLDDGAELSRDDQLATEEPLEIRPAAGGEVRTVATTMRTPGADFELAAGFLRTEGAIGDRRDVRRIEYCVDPSRPADHLYDTVTVRLAGSHLPDLGAVERYGTVSSGCGVCGTASLDALHGRGVEPLPSADGVGVDLDTLYALPGCAVSAPSSLAVAVAEEFGVTLVGFLRGRRANVYAGADRLLRGAAAPSH
jgi:FdhD protein